VLYLALYGRAESSSDHNHAQGGAPPARHPPGAAPPRRFRCIGYGVGAVPKNAALAGAARSGGSIFWRFAAQFQKTGPPSRKPPKREFGGDLAYASDRSNPNQFGGTRK